MTDRRQTKREQIAIQKIETNAQCGTLAEKNCKFLRVLVIVEFLSLHLWMACVPFVGFNNRETYLSQVSPVAIPHTLPVQVHTDIFGGDTYFTQDILSADVLPNVCSWPTFVRNENNPRREKKESRPLTSTCVSHFCFLLFLLSDGWTLGKNSGLCYTRRAGAEKILNKQVLSTTQGANGKDIKS